MSNALSRTSSFFNPRTMGLLLPAVCVATFCLSQLPFDNDGSYHLYLLALLQLTPFAVAVLRKRFSYLAFILLGQAVFTSFSRLAISRKTETGMSFSPEVIASMREQIIATLLIITVYSVAKKLLFATKDSAVPYTSMKVSTPLYAAITAYTLTYPFVFQDRLPPQVSAIASMLYHFSLVFSVTCEIAGRHSLIGFLRALIGISTVFSFFYNGFLTSTMIFGGVAFLATCLEGKFRRLPLFLIFGALFIFAQGVKGPFRAIVWSGDSNDFTLMEKAELFFEIAVGAYSSGEADFKQGITANDTMSGDERVSGAFMRLNEDPLSKALALTPGLVPFWEGETYEQILFLFIPRLIWPDKPERAFMNRFGRQYGILGEDDFSTSIAVDILTEGYINFGYTGLYCAALFFGLLIAALEFAGQHVSPERHTLPALLLLIPLMHFENNLGPILFNVALALILCLLLRITSHQTHAAPGPAMSS